VSQVPEWITPSKVAAEIKKTHLTRDEAAKLVELMARFREGRTLPRDHKPLRDGVEELRLSGQRRTFRLYFGRLDDGLVLLALRFNIKKKQNDRLGVDLAAVRLKQWRGSGQ
jgi:putative component of toxin-antitoxin plasmid stabilization module